MYSLVACAVILYRVTVEVLASWRASRRPPEHVGHELPLGNALVEDGGKRIQHIVLLRNVASVQAVPSRPLQCVVNTALVRVLMPGLAGRALRLRCLG